MKAFEMVRAQSLSQAADALGDKRDEAKVLAGGTDLLGEMKDYIVTPQRLVNIKTVPGLTKIESDKGGLKIGALVTLARLQENADVRKRFTALAEAIDVAAMPQIRNMATIGGNLCQRPRCWYYRDEHTKCLKKGGATCYAVNGENEYHAILGGGPCYIVHPSDPAVALVALNASVVITDGKTTRTVPLEQFFVLPTQNVYRENILKQNEIISHILLPAPPEGARSAYIKEREKDSYDWALSSAAVSKVVGRDGIVTEARVVLGGVAPVPWRSAAAEAQLKGKKADMSLYRAAAQASVAEAKPLSDNAYKIPLTEVVVRRALERTA